MRFRVNDLLIEYPQQPANLVSQASIGPRAVEVGVGLQHVQVGVHGFLFVGILGTQAQVAQRLPVAGESLEVAPFFRGVEAVRFDGAVQLQGQCASAVSSPLAR